MRGADVTRDEYPPADFQEFYRRTFPELLGRARLLCGHGQDAEDAVQEAYIQACRLWNRLRRYDSPEAWVYKIMKQHLWRSRRRWGRQSAVGLNVPQSSSPTASVELTAYVRTVLDALVNLPARQRQVIVLFCLDGKSQAEIAQELGLSRGAVAASIHKGRRALETALGIASLSEDALLATARRPMPAPETSPRDPVADALHAAFIWHRLAAEADRQAMVRIYKAVVQRAGVETMP